ncbi:hypothetical protein MFLAVUS_005067 [Mucor flavus]|uniref:Uncharacterized protein n=1 Tax=Mucor flavus TaxID=439312 RepID=A0ABP9YXR1_9FUNG
MEEMPVDWDHIEDIYKEDPSCSSVNFRDSRSPTLTMLSSPQVPFSLIDNNAIITPTRSPIVATDACITKPDAADKHLK